MLHSWKNSIRSKGATLLMLGLILDPSPALAGGPRQGKGRKSAHRNPPRPDSNPDPVCPGAQLEGRNFSGRSFQGRALAGLNLGRGKALGTGFQGCDLTGARFTGADLSGADFSGAILKGADFSDAELRGAILAHADLREANLEGARFNRANLEGARLDGARVGLADFQDAQGLVLDDGLLPPFFRTQPSTRGDLFGFQAQALGSRPLLVIQGPQGRLAMAEKLGRTLTLGGPTGRLWYVSFDLPILFLTQDAHHRLWLFTRRYVACFSERIFFEDAAVSPIIQGISTPPECVSTDPGQPTVWSCSSRGWHEYALDAGGEIVERTLSPTAVEAQSLTVASDRSCAFAVHPDRDEVTVLDIARGSLDRLPLPPNCRPQNLTPGHPGESWFAAPGGEAVGRIRREQGAWTVQMFPGAAHAQKPIRPDAVVRDEDGTVWFTQRNPPRLVSLDPERPGSQLPLLQDHAPESLILGNHRTLVLTWKDPMTVVRFHLGPRGGNPGAVLPDDQGKPFLQHQARPAGTLDFMDLDIGGFGHRFQHLAAWPNGSFFASDPDQPHFITFIPPVITGYTTREPVLAMVKDAWNQAWMFGQGTLVCWRHDRVLQHDHAWGPLDTALATPCGTILTCHRGLWVEHMAHPEGQTVISEPQDLPGFQGPSLAMLADCSHLFGVDPERDEVYVWNTARKEAWTLPLPPGSGPRRVLATGPDEVWFTLPGRNALGRIRIQGGQVQAPLLYTLPRGPEGHPCRLYDLAKGPDDRVWFTQKHPAAIGRLDAQGHGQLWTLPEPYVPGTLANGWGGSLIFTLDGWSILGKIHSGQGLPEGNAPMGALEFRAEPHAVDADILPVSPVGPLSRAARRKEALSLPVPTVEAVAPMVARALPESAAPASSTPVPAPAPVTPPAPQGPGEAGTAPSGPGLEEIQAFIEEEYGLFFPPDRVQHILDRHASGQDASGHTTDAGQFLPAGQFDKAFSTPGALSQLLLKALASTGGEIGRVLRPQDRRRVAYNQRLDVRHTPCWLDSPIGYYYQGVHPHGEWVPTSCLNLVIREDCLSDGSRCQTLVSAYPVKPWGF